MIDDPRRLLELEFPPLEFAWTEQLCQLYALATGFGQDPVDERELRYVIEGANQRVSPTVAVTLYWDYRWMEASGVNLAMSLHGEQRNVFHRPVPAAGKGRVTSRITGVFDKGPGRGLVIECTQDIHDVASGEPIATNVIYNFARADGGIGYSSGPAPKPHPLPERVADSVVIGTTRPEQALLYRQLGDRNPLHADPTTARAAGFDRPILHGMCTYGFAARAVLSAACDCDSSRLASIGARISAPVYPGDTLQTEVWRDGNVVSFRTLVPERGNVVVLNNGRAELR